MSKSTASHVFRKLWTSLKLPEDCLSHLHVSDSPDPVVKSAFKLGTVAQTSIGVSALSAAYFHTLRAGVAQEVSIDPRHALLEFKSEAWYLRNGELPGAGLSLFDELAGDYETKDKRHVRIHTNFPHHKQGILDILKCQPTRESIQTALLQWPAEEFETVASSRGMCVSAVRSFADWDKHPQAKALLGTPVIEFVKIGEAPKRQITGTFSKPLEGIRVLELTRVLAGPVAGRTLAAHGADVLLVTSPELPTLPFLDVETSRGKRTTQLDLTSESDRNVLFSLAQDCDVFLQSYRPDGLKAKGFGPDALAKVKPGIVVANLSAYGWNGPWRDKRGFDSLVQASTGIGIAEAEAYLAATQSTSGRHDKSHKVQLAPRPLPCQAIDHAAGYLLSSGIHAALCKTITEGGSWEVRVSLAAVGQWIRSLGQLEPEVAFLQAPDLPPRAAPQAEDLATLSMDVQQTRSGETKRVNANESDHSVITTIRHSAHLSETPVAPGSAPCVLNAHRPEWLPRR